MGALISDVLDLSYCTIPVSLRLRSAVFKDVLTLVGATITGQFELTGSELNGRNDDGDAFLDLKVAVGTVRLVGATIKALSCLMGPS
ncbi:MAG TPA: hypothetical protein VIJ07_06105 [Dermatophilaceae bacterium]